MTAQNQTVVNYTEDQTAMLVNEYKAGETVEALAEKLGKSVRSIVAKLSHEGVYQPKTKAKGETTRVTKAALVDVLADRLGVERKQLESLEKATHEALELLVG